MQSSWANYFEIFDEMFYTQNALFLSVPLLEILKYQRFWSIFDANFSLTFLNQNFPLTTKSIWN